MYLVIAEKPELAKDIAYAIIKDCETERAGVYRGKGIDDREYIVTSAFGHLMTLQQPEKYDPKYKKWNLDDLPISFRDWKVIPADEDYKNARLKVISYYLKQAEAVIHAGDPDEEGQLLIDEILEYYHFSRPVYRVLINDNSSKTIQEEFKNLKDNRQFLSIGRSANARRIADMCFGINESRLACLKLQRHDLSIGRVQTPTLGLVVTRDLAISNHVKEKYYEAVIEVNLEGNKLPFTCFLDKKYMESHDIKYISDKNFWEDLFDKLNESLQIHTEVFREKIVPPLPYNLTILQSEMNKKYGYSMSKTLEITQNLRDRYKAISYNRSDCRYLKMEHYTAASKLFQTILNGSFIEKLHMDFSLCSKCFDDKNISAHHAIIPLAVNISIEQLNEEERNVYMAITQQYALQFLPPAENVVSVSKIMLADGEYTHEFIYRSKKQINPGFLKYFPKKKEEKVKYFLDEGIRIGRLSSKKIITKETKPLQRYTEGTLCLDMSNISKYVENPDIKKILKEKDKGKKGENGSIGTVATRGEIVNTLLKRGFIKKDGKHIVSTELGRQFYELLPKEITSADITAKWWLLQEKIKKGEITDINIIQESVVKEFLNHMHTAYNTNVFKEEFRKIEVGKCPVCGKVMEQLNGKYGKYYRCSSCKFHVTGSVCGKEISLNQFERLIMGDTVMLHGLHGKKGKFSAEIKLEVENDKGVYKMRFPQKN